MKRKPSIILGICIVILLAIIAYKQFVQPPVPEIVFVNNFELFNGFNYKKELTKKFERIEKARKSRLDSMRYALSEFKVQLENTDKSDLEKLQLFNIERTNYLSLEKQFYDDASVQSQEYDELIFERLNQYVEEYSKENNIDILIGVSESGNVMYGDVQFDITDKLIDYVNSKYEG